jgi:tryptophan-rich sensory protein
MKKQNYIKLFVSIVVAQLAGIIGSLYTSNSISTWYKTLVRPEIAPPNWVFGPVWTTLYMLMGISAYIIWSKGYSDKKVKLALTVYFGQLLLNTLWSILFFGLQDIRSAFIEIIALWIMIALNVFLFGKISKTAGYLLIPYLLWVSFASYLNYLFMILNN